MTEKNTIITGTCVCYVGVKMTPDFEALTKREKEKVMLQIHLAIAEGNYDYDEDASFPYIIDSIKLGRKNTPSKLECRSFDKWKRSCRYGTICVADR